MRGLRGGGLDRVYKMRRSLLITLVAAALGVALFALLLVVSVLGFTEPARAQSPVLLSGDPARDLVVLFQPVGNQNRPVYASFGRPARLSPSVQVVSPPVRGLTLAGNARGDGIAVWVDSSDGSGGPVRAATRGAGAHSFGPPQSVTGKKTRWAEALMNASGDVLVRFLVPSPDVGERRYTAWRPAGGRFAPGQPLPHLAGTDLGLDAVGLDDGGQAVALASQGEIGVSRPFWVTSLRGAPWQFTGAGGEPRFFLEDSRLLGVNGSGLALALVSRAGADELVARVPGGPEWRVESVNPQLDVRGFALGEGGHAVLVDSDAYASIRSPDGSWTEPQRLGRLAPEVPAGSIATAVDPEGAVAIVYRARDDSVRGAYAAPGAPLAQTTLYSARAVEAARDHRPAVAIGGGQAVAAWQQSDGDRVATVMRTFGVGGAGRRSIVARQPAWVREGPASRCLGSGRTLLRTREARLYLVRTEYEGGAYTEATEGCFFKRGAVVTPDSDAGVDADPDPTVAALGGPLVAMRMRIDLEEANEENAQTGVPTEDYVVVTDLRDPERGLNADYPVGDGEVADVVVNRRGGVAWIDCTPDCDRRRPVLAVHRRHSDRRSVDRVARGRDIEMRSLELHGERLVWIEGRRRHATRLR